MASFVPDGKLRLRDYQENAVSQTWDWLCANDGAPIIEAPVGAGKSVIMAEIMRQACAEAPDTRILMVTHSSELVQQNYDKLKVLWPDAPAGIYSAALKRKEIEAQILFCTIQSVYRMAYRIGRVHLILVDEAHTIGRKEKTMWGRFLTDTRIVNYDHRMVGLTGTPWRLDTGSLIDGDDRLFHGVSYRIRMIELIERGYLCPVVSQPTGLRIDTDGVRKTAGDFNMGQLSGRVDDVIEEAVDDFIQRGHDRRTWMIFAPTIENAQHIRGAVESRGIGCAIVTADTSSDERNAILSAMRAGTLRSAVSVGTLTTGIDVPPVDMVVALRPTLSSALVIQMIGRGMRLSPDTGKTDCLLCDYAGWLMKHGPVDLIEPPPRKGSGPAPTKQCPECETLLPIHVMDCPTCGYAFPPPEKEKARLRASELPALSTQAEEKTIKVTGVTYSRHKSRKGKPDTLRVTYKSMLSDFSRWVPIGHDGPAQFMGKKWWAENRSPEISGPAPYTLDEALSRTNELRQPAEIVVRMAGKYPEIIKVNHHEHA
ncbi:DEAD/DEAH box helicase [Komagataeibacter medellinensis]|uniref:DEAD/DEAH box helicase n=1 Tax=Komagataeibacter medellinensis TaxID=1177712 RepID=A0ABQ6VR62_9PROT|nr:DEAD/DEAH box helicase [Komagataeibacter medellinensis]KAB8122439.1 DEAD/DEAH box helicase [Komagataeibacter medellinensis]